jgi:hypothetical protein
MDEEDRAELVAKVRDAIQSAFHGTPSTPWEGDLFNSSVRIPPGMNMGPYFERMAEAAVDALADDIGHGFDPISGATV